jgi:hypothetical protein
MNKREKEAGRGADEGEKKDTRPNFRQVFPAKNPFGSCMHAVLLGHSTTTPHNPTRAASCEENLRPQLSVLELFAFPDRAIHPQDQHSGLPFEH